MMLDQIVKWPLLLVQRIQDDSISISLYPSGQRLTDLSGPLISNEQSIFTSDFKKTFSEINQSFEEILTKPKCIGFIDNIKKSTDERGFLMNGWVALAGDADSLNLLAIDASGKVVGAGISGFERRDVSDQLGLWARNTGFKVVSKSVPHLLVGVRNSKVKCRLNYEVQNG